MSQNTITINRTVITGGNSQWFTVIDGYLMRDEIAQRYKRLVPMRVLRAIDVLDDKSKKDYSLWFTLEISKLDYWSAIWTSCYLGYHESDIHTRERDILFNRLMQQYHKSKNEL